MSSTAGFNKPTGQPPDFGVRGFYRLVFQRGLNEKNIPQSIQEKADQTIEQLKAGVPYFQFHGKKLNCKPWLVSIPLGQRWRLVFSLVNKKPVQFWVMSHEAYNNFYRQRKCA